MPVGQAQGRPGRAEVLPPVGRHDRQPLGRLAAQETQQIAGAVVGPVQVLDDEHGRPDGREQRAYRAEHPVPFRAWILKGLR